MIFTIVFTGIIRTFRTGADAKRAADAVRRGSSPSTPRPRGRLAELWLERPEDNQDKSREALFDGFPRPFDRRVDLAERQVVVDESDRCPYQSPRNVTSRGSASSACPDFANAPAIRPMLYGDHDAAAMAFSAQCMASACCPRVAYNMPRCTGPNQNFGSSSVAVRRAARASSGRPRHSITPEHR